MAQERMIDELLSQLDALHAAATQGEWELDPKIRHIDATPAWEIVQRDEAFWLAKVQQPLHHPTPNGRANSDWIIAAQQPHPRGRQS